MNSTYFKLQKRNVFRSLHYSPHKNCENDSSSNLQIKNQKVHKPDFLYFTQRQRQNINFFENADSLLKLKQSRCQNPIDEKITNNFQKKFRLKTKYFNIKKISQHNNSQHQAIKEPNLVVQGKSKLTLKKKAWFLTSQEPCVGMYNAKPQNLMKKLSKNETFRKGRSCHTSIQTKENHESLLLSNKLSYQKPEKLQLICHKGNQVLKIPKTGRFRSLKNNSSTQKIKDFQKSEKPKIRIKCFDMSKQTSRSPFKTIENKIQQSDCQNDYIKKNYRKQMYMPRPLNESQLENLYEKQKEKYQIESSCGILKYIKLQDFIKIHRKENTMEQQNFQ